MFQGFTDSTFEFFMAIGFNNNREFFHENHDWYMRSVREPCLELAGALTESVHALDPALDTRPDKVVSRINRDLRYSRDKSPYRDYMWLSFHHTGEDRHISLETYFEISCDGAGCGAGIYSENRPLMNGFRRSLRQDPAAFLDVLAAIAPCHADIDPFKRMPVPEGIPAELNEWYRARTFYVSYPIGDFDLIKSPALADEINGVFRKLQPLFRYFASLSPEEEIPE